MSEIQVFDFHGLQLRALPVNGEPWFVAKDVATVLDYSDTQAMTRRLDDDEVQNRQFVGSNPRGENLINEPGLYSAILGSRKPEAKTFKKWVTSDVLPAIRKHGAYMTAPTIDALVANPDLVIQLATNLKIEQQKREQAEQATLALAPKAEVFDDFLTSEGSYEVGDAAKLLRRAGVDTGQQRLFSYLDQIGWTFRRGGERRIKQEITEQGLLTYKAQSYRHPSTHELRIAPPQIRVTPKGLEKLRLKMLPTMESIIEEQEL